MANKFFGAISHIGGADGDLDAISKDVISDGDGAYVIDATNNTIDVYTCNASGDTTVSETTPILHEYIMPDDEGSNPGKRWERVKTGVNIINDIEAIAAALKTGSDAKLVTGTKGTTNDFPIWNGDGDIIGSGVNASEIGVLASAREWTKQQNFNENAVTSSGNSVALNIDDDQCMVHTLTENTTFAAPSNLNAGATMQLRVVQAAGVYTIAWNAVFDFGAADTPAAPAASGDVVVFSMYSDGTTVYVAEMTRTEA